MNNEPTFRPFSKMARLSRECVITEKIDGTNAQIFIWDEGALKRANPGNPKDLSTIPVGPAPADVPWLWIIAAPSGFFRIAAGSKSRWLTEHEDNFAFAKWVIANAEQLAGLGHGRHFGEWWGSGIQRGYGLKNGERRFSLFNTIRWNMGLPEGAPLCCDIVPVLYKGEFRTEAVTIALDQLIQFGSRAVPCFRKPEGVVVYHTAANFCFKKTIENDEQPKSQVK